ncbi:MAG TPA: hydrolase TatD [Actinobacteria bacterium]|nr:hydrolase TatD [Actinomycetota bacterium]
MYFIDTHAHLDMLKKLTPAEAVSASKEERVRYIINVGSSIDGSKKSLEYAQKFPGVFASIGIHPHYAEGFGNKEMKLLESLISGYNEESDIDPGTDAKRYDKVVAVGETGFDFYRNISPRPDQERAFRAQIELAIRYDIPIIIHDRDAHEDILRVLKGYSGRKGFRGVVHCFSGDTAFAMKCLELGLYISYTGVITFPNAADTLEVVREVPLERIFIETDAPFLAPQAKRGKENFPGYVRYIAQKIAEIKNLPIEEVAKATSINAQDFFGINTNDYQK